MLRGSKRIKMLNQSIFRDCNMLISSIARPEETCKTKISAGIVNNPFPPTEKGKQEKQSLSYALGKIKSFIPCS